MRRRRLLSTLAGMISMRRGAVLLTMALVAASGAPGAGAQDLRSRPALDGPGRPFVASSQDAGRARPPAATAQCPAHADLRSLAERYLATPNPAFPGKGPTVPALSMSWDSADCGTFTHAAGLRDIESGKRITPATPMGVASMTKPVMAALALKLDEAGLFGPDGLDTPVDRLLTPAQVTELTVGLDLEHPRCPGEAPLFDRAAGEYRVTRFSCPDLSQVTVRQLMVGNHGMYDYVNEDLEPDGSHWFYDGLYFDLYRFLGLDPAPPVSSRSGYDYLARVGLKRNDSAVIGGNVVPRDFEVSFGNTGFQLLGVILESRTGRSLNELIEDLIVAPLGIDDMFLYVDPDERGRVASGYEIWTGEPDIEGSGVYRLVDFNGHSALNTRSLGRGLPANLTMAGGAGGLVASPQSYRVFLDAFVNGDLIGPRGRVEFERSFVPLPEWSLGPGHSMSNGLGLFRESTRGFAPWRDVDLYHHGGSLPGVRCENVVARDMDPGVAPVTGVLCINARLNAHPSPFDLMVTYIQRWVVNER
jgi:CubicO group peptidase (beta-lactamase class C family)